MRRIAITGALGHIGSRLIRDLPGAFPGVEIVMLDNLSTQRYASLFHLPAEGRYRFIEADILDADLEPLLRGADAAVHLAALTDAAGSFAIKEKIEAVNLAGTKRVAKACSELGVPLLFPSTTSVYGVSSGIVGEDGPETDLKPQSPYAVSKLAAEKVLATLDESRGLDFVVCRLGTIFGISPGIRFHTAVNKFIWQACMGVPLTVWRTALDQRRPYLDLEDAVGAIIFMLRRRNFDRKLYNVVTINSTVRDIIESIQSCLGAVSIEFVDSSIMNQLSYEVSAERMASLGFKTKGSLGDGISATIRLLRGDCLGAVVGTGGPGFPIPDLSSPFRQ